MGVEANLYDAVQGARIEIGSFTLDPSSINADSQGEEEVTITGAESGDRIFVSCEDLDDGLVCAGAKVTDDDTITVYLQNTTEAAVNGASKTWAYILVKF